VRFQLGRPPALGFARPKGRSQGGFSGVFRRDALRLSPQPPWAVSRLCGATTGAVPHPVAGDGGGLRAATDQAASPWASNLSCTSRHQVRVYSPRCGSFVIGPPLRGAFAVVESSEKVFRVRVGPRVEVVSVDRLKPHLGADTPRPASPPTRARPPLLPAWFPDGDSRPVQPPTGGWGGAV
jgi:hypothetical protein